jgi:hypothetical protein
MRIPDFPVRFTVSAPAPGPVMVNEEEFVNVGRSADVIEIIAGRLEAKLMVEQLVDP